LKRFQNVGPLQRRHSGQIQGEGFESRDEETGGKVQLQSDLIDLSKRSSFDDLFWNRSN